MSKEELKELDSLQLKIEAWLEKVNEHNHVGQQLQKEKKKLLKELEKLEEKYGVKNADRGKRSH